MKKLLSWLDHHLLTVTTAILIVIIPLYPKLPVADLIEGYIVRLRVEDLLVATASLLYMFLLARRRLSFPRHPLARIMGAYILVGLLSSLSALFITQTVPLERQHLFKLFLHLARRVEYFSLFFIAYSSVRTRRELKLFLSIALATLLATLIYGLGQKYLYWPAFSTMNREFSKGMRLYLGPTSRVMSTFAGHYDFASYLMLSLLMLVPVYWLARGFWRRLGLGLTLFFAYWLLMLTASRTSWIGYMLGIAVIALLLVRLKGWGWALRRYISLTFLSLALMFVFGDLSTRFLQLLNSPQTIASFLNLDAGQVEPYLFKVKDLGYKLNDIKRLGLSAFRQNPPAGMIADSELEVVADPSDLPPTVVKPGTALPPDVTEAEEALRHYEATPSATATPSAVTSTGGYSENALKYGLSIGIRLDALWPRALAGFLRNPLLGSGYSTLVKAENTEFTQAESTDNDYLRMLGETGILGTVLFLSLPLTLIFLAYRALRTTASLLFQALFLGAIGATVGLLVNATYIDVFESSKVAYSFWLLSALVARAIELNRGSHV